MNKYNCGVCGFPKIIPECPTSKFGEIVWRNGTDKETLKHHFLKHHPTQYRKLLLILKNNRGMKNEKI